MTGSLYLIPTPLSDNTTIQAIMPEGVSPILSGLFHFVVENERTARRFLRAAGYKEDFANVRLYVLDKETPHAQVQQYLQPLLNGHNVGLMSEAGCPGVADPGAQLIELCHQKNIKVIPLVGPSSILMALMASGMNGQSFCFHGYLPIQQPEKIKKIKELEKTAKAQKQTQIFIETPFRNNKLVEDIITNCEGNTRLCIAVDITGPEEMIRTKPVSEWKVKLPDLHKRPAVFLIF